MTDTALRLKDELLRLSEEDRTELAHVLWDSLDADEATEQDEAACIEELNRRADDLTAGRTTAEPFRDVIAELREEALRERQPMAITHERRRPNYWRNRTPKTEN